MARISTYQGDQSISLDDFLIGSDAEDQNKTKNFRIGDLFNLPAFEGMAFFRVTDNSGNIDFTVSNGETINFSSEEDNIVFSPLGGNDVNIDLAIQSGLTAGQYVNPTITLNSWGIITAIADGLAGGSYTIANPGGGAPIFSQNTFEEIIQSLYTTDQNQQALIDNGIGKIGIETIADKTTTNADLTAPIKKIRYSNSLTVGLDTAATVNDIGKYFLVRNISGSVNTITAASGVTLNGNLTIQNQQELAITCVAINEFDVTGGQ